MKNERKRNMKKHLAQHLEFKSEGGVHATVCHYFYYLIYCFLTTKWNFKVKTQNNKRKMCSTYL